MTSYTSWLRFEPRPRAASLEHSFEARVHDPLWLLGRQWQLGEFQGEDVGTPVQVQASIADSPIDAIGIGSGAAVRAYDPAKQPLEMIVEQEALPETSVDAWRRAAQYGLQFLRMLDPPLRLRYRAPIVDRYGLTIPAAGDADHPLDRAFQLVTADRLPDGFLMAADWTRWLEQRQPPPAFVDAADLAEFTDAARRWLKWKQTVLAQPADTESAWSPSRLGYAVSVSGANPAAPAPASGPPVSGAPGSTTARVALEAGDYRGGRLDWYSFDAVPPAAFAQRPAAKPRVQRHACLPASMAFRGMPAARWWEFEDATVALGNTDVAPEDLARLLLLEFAFCYANDYFVMPVQLVPGSLCRIELTAVNTFGDVIAVERLRPSAPDAKPWRMFAISAGESDQLDAFFLPPALAVTVDGPVVEEVLLTRDEMANVAWAVERVVESTAGYATPLQERTRPGEREEEEGASASQSADRWTYTLASRVPDGWLPYVPVQLPRVNGVRSRAVQLQRISARPASALLRVPGAELLNEEEVPRRGVRITRSYQLARWINGETYVWSTRAVTAGRGESASGLRFDALSPSGSE